MQKIIKNIADGDKGIDQTVSEMWRLINRDISDPLVISTAKGLTSPTEEQTASNIFNFVWKTIPYKSDPEWAEQLTAPVHLLNGNKIGEDCDGLVMVLVALLLAAKIDARIKVIAWRIQDYTHVVAEAKINGKWTVLDPTLKSAGYGKTYKTIREKIYRNKSMGRMITLEDSPCSAGRRRRNDPVNQNIIVLGNDITENSHNWDKLDFNQVNPDARRSRPIIERITKEVPVTKRVIEKQFEPIIVERTIPIPQRAFSKKPAVYYPEFY